MEFITDFISTGKSKSFDDLVREYRESQNPVAVKTAAVAEPQKKEAGKADEADSSGQLDVEPLHQKGESTTMPKNGPSAKKESTDGKGASPTGADADEADSSGQLDVEPLHQDGESTTLPKNGPAGKKDASTKEAAIEDLPQAVQDKIKGKKKDDKDDSCDECDVEDKDKEEKEAAACSCGCDNCPDCGCDKCNKNTTAAVKEEDDEEEKEAKKDDEEEETKEANKELRFVKLANLDDKQEAFMRDYWLQEFDPDYVDAMLAKK